MATFRKSLHTRKHPYCANLRCSCHTDVAYHKQVTNVLYVGKQSLRKEHAKHVTTH